MQQKDQFLLFNLSEFENWIKSEKVSRSIKRIQNHHTWKPSYKDFKDDNHFTLLKGMKRSHLKRGFSDIAQNITTFPDGTLAICRPLNKVPAGIKGANRGGICIEHVGNFDEGGDRMKKKHKETIIQLNAILCNHFNLHPNSDSIVYHHWWDLNTGRRKNGKGTTKSCPGTNFFGGNMVENAEDNFIPIILVEYLQIRNGFSDIVTEPELFKIRYSKSGKIEFGKELQSFLNQFPGIKIKVDGWPGKKTSDAFRMLTGYYLKGDPRG